MIIEKALDVVLNQQTIPINGSMTGDFLGILLGQQKLGGDGEHTTALQETPALLFGLHF